MKKKWLIIPAAILAIGIGTAGVLTNAVFTEKPDNIVDERQQNCFGNRNCGNYIDENKDGVCDNYSEGNCPQDGYGNGKCLGNFTDENNDGVCDNYSERNCLQNVSGNGKHRGNGCHHR